MSHHEGSEPHRLTSCVLVCNVPLRNCPPAPTPNPNPNPEPNPKPNPNPNPNPNLNPNEVPPLPRTLVQAPASLQKPSPGASYRPEEGFGLRLQLRLGLGLGLGIGLALWLALGIWSVSALHGLCQLYMPVAVLRTFHCTGCLVKRRLVVGFKIQPGCQLMTINIMSGARVRVRIRTRNRTEIKLSEWG